MEQPRLSLFFFLSVEEKNTGLYVRHLIPYVYTLFPGSPSICPHASLCILCCDFLYSCVDLMRLRNTPFANTLELSVITVSPLCTLVTFTVAMEERREGWREEEKDGRKEGREERGLFWLTVWGFHHGCWGLLVGAWDSCHSDSEIMKQREINPGMQAAFDFLVRPGPQLMGWCLHPLGWVFPILTQLKNFVTDTPTSFFFSHGDSKSYELSIKTNQHTMEAYSSPSGARVGSLSWNPPTSPLLFFLLGFFGSFPPGP